MEALLIIGFLVVTLFLDWYVFGAGFFHDRKPYLFRERVEVNKRNT